MSHAPTFSTALMGEHGSVVTGSAVYAGHFAALALGGFVRTQYFLRHPELQVANIDPQSVREMKVRSVSFLVATGVTFALAFVIPAYNMFGMLLAFATSLVLRTRKPV